MRSVIVLDDAFEDIKKAREFYDSVELGVGDYFIDTILSDIESLAFFHGVHAKHFGFHRMLSSRFPFGVYYDEHSENTRVIAVLDLRRDPVWLRSELGDR